MRKKLPVYVEIQIIKFIFLKREIYEIHIRDYIFIHIQDLSI